MKKNSWLVGSWTNKLLDKIYKTIVTSAARRNVNLQMVSKKLNGIKNFKKQKENSYAAAVWRGISKTNIERKRSNANSEEGVLTLAIFKKQHGHNGLLKKLISKEIKKRLSKTNIIIVSKDFQRWKSKYAYPTRYLIAK